MLTISAGHYGKGTGARGFLDEGEQAIRAVRELEKRFENSPIATKTIIDTESKSQQQNLAYLIRQHNSSTRNLDISIHFNAIAGTRKDGIGTEVLYVNPAIQPLASKLSAGIAQAAGFKNRGAKLRTNLAFLNGTAKPALILEICFVNSETDVWLYERHSAKIFDAIFTIVHQYLMPAVSVPSPVSAPITLSHPALLQKVQAIFNNRATVRKQLEQGVKNGAYQEVWLENLDQGRLTLADFLALTTLQYDQIQKKL